MSCCFFLILSTFSAACAFASGEGESPVPAQAPQADQPAIESLSLEQFKSPGMAYRPVDCWWWDGGYLNEEKLKWQLAELQAKGVGGTWLYPRFGASQPLSSEPGFWTDDWWRFVDLTLAEHERLGMQQWANDWLGRLTKNYFQEQLTALSSQFPELAGQRLVLHTSSPVADGFLEVKVPADQSILSAGAYRLHPGSKSRYDHESRVDLLSSIKDHQIHWAPPSQDWIIAVVAGESHGLNYLKPAVAEKWIEIFFARYAERVGPHLGKALTAYGPDERQVLNGNFLYCAEVAEMLKTRHGIDLLPNLPALFLDLGPITDKIRCRYHSCVVDLLEAAFYGRIQQWLHDRGMKQATIATWGRKNICGQTYNYGDFFRMMRYFDITGNEDSVESGASAFIDTKLSSSIAHLNGHHRVAVCGYWGTGWGFTQEENIARTNVNFALGVNLLNTHGGMYSLMGSRNEFVPPAVHFYQPYWQTWRTFYDSVARLSYVLSQGEHRADVAIVYPQSTLHAHWNGSARENRAFDPPARRAERMMFGVGESVYKQAIDFDFVDERSVAGATLKDGKLAMRQLRFSVVVLPGMTTIPLEVAHRLREFVDAGGTLIAAACLPTASPENGRDDPELIGLWEDLFGPNPESTSGVSKSMARKGAAFLVDEQAAAAIPRLIRESGPADVITTASELIYTHNQVGSRHVYYLVNPLAERRTVEITVSARGIPERWDPQTGLIRPFQRYQPTAEGTRLKLDFDPRQGLLVVIRPGDESPQWIEDNLQHIDSVIPQGDGFTVNGTAGEPGVLSAKLLHGGRRFEGHVNVAAPAVELPLDPAWECEYAPTIDNRWGDFRYPAGNDLIGPEMPVVKYRDETDPDESRQCASPEFDDRTWKDVKCSYGPYWQQLGPFNVELDSPEIQTQVASSRDGKPPSLDLNGKPAQWQTHDYSLKHGSERMEVHQQPADDGLGTPSEDFLVLDRLQGKRSVCYLRTRVYSGTKATTRLHFGNPRDKQLVRQAWLNGEQVVSVHGDLSATSAPVSLEEGWNPLVLRLELPARTRKGLRTTKGIPPVPPAGQRVQTYAIFHPSPELPDPPRFLPLLRWHEQVPALLHDCGDGSPQTGWFRFIAPPGALAAKLNLKAKAVEGWVNGKKIIIADGILEFAGTGHQPSAASVVALRVAFHPGCYAGAAFTDPIQFVMGRGLVRTGDWCKQGLRYYSGGLNYSQTIVVTPEQLKDRIVLDLGDVRTSAELLVNGQGVGTRLARPFSFDLSGHLKPGRNRITVKVLNTLANHMSSLPSRYVLEGQTVSGMLGPVRLQISPRVTIRCEPADEK